MNDWHNTTSRAIPLSSDTLVKLYDFFTRPPRPSAGLMQRARRQRAYRDGRNESYFIDLIAYYMRTLGYTVDMYAHDLHHGGQHDHETHTIRVNVHDARKALKVLAHEVGHAVGWHMRHHVAKRSQVHRERQAYVYGWRVLQLSGADVLIGRKEWIQSCRESHDAFLAQEATKAASCSAG